MTLERQHCRPGQGWAGFSPAVHRMPIHNCRTSATPPSKPPPARRHHCTGAACRLATACRHRPHLASLRSAACTFVSRRPSVSTADAEPICASLRYDCEPPAPCHVAPAFAPATPHWSPLLPASSCCSHRPPASPSFVTLPLPGIQRGGAIFKHGTVGSGRAAA